MSARLRIALAAALAFGVAGCAEQAQTASDPGAKKADAKAWEGASNGAYTAGGWKAGDKDSWEAQIKARAQRGQNEYARSAAAPAEGKSQ